ncbi:unnamed protein product, partial [Brenthis ino]
MQEANTLTETGSVTIQDKDLTIFITFAALVLASEIEDAEQKKRGAGKANPLNSIPTGAQKPDYTYNIYSQTPSSQSGPSQNYQASSNSFYPSQSASQYYASGNNADISSSYTSQPQVSSQNSQSHFVPINFVPNPGYQTKYQFVSQKPNSNVLAVLQQPSAMLQYSNGFYSPNPTNHVNQGSLLGPLAHGQLGFGPNIHPLSFLSQPTMFVLPQSHASLYNNLVYPNHASNFYNYYPSTSQIKYSYTPGPPISQPSEYEKVQTSISQSISKEEHGAIQNADYTSATNANSAYNGRSAYSKI